MGLGLARTVRRQQAQTLAFIDAVLRIRHELQYRLTPLPDVFLALQESREAAVAAFFSGLAGSLSAADTCTVGYACQQALGQTIEICSGFLCIYLALPLLEMVLSLLQTMIGG